MADPDSRRRARLPLPSFRGGRRALHPDHAGPDDPEPADAVAGSIDSVIGDSGWYQTSGRQGGKLSLEHAAAVAAHEDGFVWIGLQQPTAEQFAQVAAQFALPALAVDDAVAAHQRPKLEVYDDVVFVVLKPVRYVDPQEVVDVSEVAVFLGRHFVVTVRHGLSDALTRVRAELDRAGPDLLEHGPSSVLYRAFDLVVDGYEEVAAAISLDVEDIEAQVFGGDSHDHAERIYKLKRELLEFRRAVVPLADPLARLAEGKVPGIPTRVAPYFRDVHDHVLRTTDVIEAHDRMLTDVLTADLAQVSVRQNQTAMRQNEDMRKISAWAAIALVPTAIAGIYGMNFENMPELTYQYGYFIVLGVIVALCVTLYLLFRKNGWL